MRCKVPSEVRPSQTTQADKPREHGPVLSPTRGREWKLLSHWNDCDTHSTRNSKGVQELKSASGIDFLFIGVSRVTLRSTEISVSHVPPPQNNSCPVLLGQESTWRDHTKIIRERPGSCPRLQRSHPSLTQPSASELTLQADRNKMKGPCFAFFLKQCLY